MRRGTYYLLLVTTIDNLSDSYIFLIKFHLQINKTYLFYNKRIDILKTIHKKKYLLNWIIVRGEHASPLKSKWYYIGALLFLFVH